MKKSNFLGAITLCAIGGAAIFLSKKSNRDAAKKYLDNVLDKIPTNISNTKNSSKIEPCNKKYLWTAENDEVKEILS